MWIDSCDKKDFESIGHFDMFIFGSSPGECPKLVKAHHVISKMPLFGGQNALIAHKLYVHRKKCAKQGIHANFESDWSIPSLSPSLSLAQNPQFWVFS